MTEQVRVDKWLWAVRVFKTRTAANDACAAGKVRINDEVAKPATRVKVGDRVSARRGDRRFELVVEALITKRVGAAQAAECYRDESPPVVGSGAGKRGQLADGGHEMPVAARRRGDGRPTKRDRRALDRLKGRNRT